MSHNYFNNRCERDVNDRQNKMNISRSIVNISFICTYILCNELYTGIHIYSWLYH